MECLNYALAKVIVFKTVAQNLVLGFGEKKRVIFFSPGHLINFD